MICFHLSLWIISNFSYIFYYYFVLDAHTYKLWNVVHVSLIALTKVTHLYTNDGYILYRGGNKDFKPNRHFENFTLNFALSSSFWQTLATENAKNTYTWPKHDQKDARPGGFFWNRVSFHRQLRTIATPALV